MKDQAFHPLGHIKYYESYLKNKYLNNIEIGFTGLSCVNVSNSRQVCDSKLIPFPLITKQYICTKFMGFKM